VLLGKRDSTGATNALFISYENPGFRFFTEDNNGNQLIFSTPDTAFDDSTPHAIIVNKTADNAGEIYVDDMGSDLASVDTDEGFNHDNFVDNYDYRFWSSTEAGTDDSFIEAKMGVIEFNNEPYSQSNRESFVSQRPEV
jgi:hypothetical protein